MFFIVTVFTLKSPLKKTELKDLVQTVSRRDSIKLVCFRHIYKGHKFCDFLFSYTSSEKGSIVKGSKFLPFRRDPDKVTSLMYCNSSAW